jgi:hypothetical protein
VESRSEKDLAEREIEDVSKSFLESIAIAPNGAVGADEENRHPLLSVIEADAVSRMAKHVPNEKEVATERLDWHWITVGKPHVGQSTKRLKCFARRHLEVLTCCVETAFERK